MINHLAYHPFNYSKLQSIIESRASVFSIIFKLSRAFLNEYADRGNSSSLLINSGEAGSSIGFLKSANTTFLGAIEPIKSGKSYAVNTEAMPHVKSTSTGCQ